MAINYNFDDKLGKVDALLNVYQSWFVAVIEASLHKQDIPVVPDSLNKWLQSVNTDAFDIDGRYLKQKNRLIQLHDELVKNYEVVNAPVDESIILRFAAVFKDFISTLHKFCHNAVLEEWGLDVLTGLKNIYFVKQDLAIEMQRLSRENYVFCIGLARIDNFDVIEENMDRAESNKIIKTVAGLVQASLRSYDDAYRISRDHFIICLKQSDIRGGSKGLERLRNIMEDAQEKYVINGEEKLISMSCCVAAPMVDDDVDDLIDNLYVDLDEQIKEQGAVLTYQELSPLQRYVLKDKE